MRMGLVEDLALQEVRMEVDTFGTVASQSIGNFY